MTSRKPWLVLPDQLSIRVFFDAGIVRGLSERLGEGPTAVFLVPRTEAAGWTGRLDGGRVLRGEELTAAGGGLGERALRDTLAVVVASYEFHGGFRLRTLTA